MGELLASRRAGRNLGTVVLLLLLPVFVLWLMFFNESRGNREAIAKARAGLELSARLAPLFYGETERVDAAQLAAIAASEDRLNIEDDARFASMVAVMPHQGAGAIKRDVIAIRQMMDGAVRRSGLNLEPDAEGAALIHAVLMTLPDMLLNQQVVLKEMGRRVGDGVYEAADQHYFMHSMGKTSYMMAELDRELKAALAGDEESQSARDALQLLSNLRKQSQGLSDIAMATGMESTTFIVAQKLDTLRKNDDFARSAAQLTHLAAQRLNQILSARADAYYSRYLLLTSIGLLFSLAGLGAAILLFKRNLSQLDHVEAAKRESDDLANQLAAINAEVSGLNRELADKMQALKTAQDEILKKGRMEQLGQLTATVAHELRNPLGAVRTSAFLLQRKLKSLNLDMDQQFERINNGISRCDNTITQLLDFSRTKKISAKRAVFDDWLVRCVEDAARQLPQTVQVDCVLGLGDLEVAFDGARLERAVVNLINNAAEAMVGNGKDKPSSQQAEPRVTVSTALEEGRIALRVSDNGPGIPAENLEKIREPLFTTKNFGTGLGIPAVEQIAVQHDGRLDIESEPGRGATFTIWLPQRAEAARAA